MLYLLMQSILQSDIAAEIFLAELEQTAEAQASPHC